MVYKYPWQQCDASAGEEGHPCMDLHVYVDTDFAGCMRTRRSTSGGMMFYGEHLIKHWTSTQATIALSSGEAELHGVVRGSAEAFGMRSIGWDLGVSMRITVHTDSSAAKGIGERRGIGRVRHRTVEDLWVQEKVSAKEIRLRKVQGKTILRMS